jgi:hypothetical protein
MEMQFVFCEVGSDIIMYDFQEFYALKCGHLYMLITFHSMAYIHGQLSLIVLLA